MSKSSNDFKELEKWFKQDNYDSIASFNQKDWANQIAKRFFIDDALKHSKVAILDELMPRLMKSPLDSFDAGYINGWNKRQANPYSTRSVMSLSISDITTLHDLSNDSSINPETLFDAWNIQRGGVNEDGSINDNKSAGLGSFAHLRIDLNARNNTIESDFRCWLRNYRKAISFPELKPHPVNLELKFADWQSYKILEFFDVLVWCRWSGRHIKKEQMLALVLNGGDPSKFITINQKLTEIINYRNVMALLCES